MSDNLPNPAAWDLPACDFEPLEGGHRNTVLRGTGDNSGWVFKKATRSEKELKWIAEAQNAALKAGFQVPQLKRHSHGKAWFNFSFSGWTAEPYLQGKTLPEKMRPQLIKLLKRFHKLCGHIRQRPRFASAWDLMATDRGGDIDLLGMPRPLVANCRAAWGALGAQPMTVIHGDLNVSNIAVDDAGHIILIDWDEARRDYPLFDLVAIGADTRPVAKRAALAYEVACCWRLEPDRARELAQQL